MRIAFIRLVFSRTKNYSRILAYVLLQFRHYTHTLHIFYIGTAATHTQQSPSVGYCGSKLDRKQAISVYNVI